MSEGADDKPAGKPEKPKRRATAESMATRQREISVAEFFSKNRHLLGFDNPSKALLTTVKEAVDNALDACEEAGIMPVIRVDVTETGTDRYRVTVEDNGPGIVRAQVPKIFGKLLYGSKFHTLKQSRGQQGIGISAAGMYGQMTTGRPVEIISRTGARQPAQRYEVRIDTQKNMPEVLAEAEIEWESEHGTRVSIELSGLYRKGAHSVDTYLDQTAIANPHAGLSYRLPGDDMVDLPAAAAELPREPREIKPHPHGVELGTLMKMLSSEKGRTLKGALTDDFARVSPRIADELLALAKLSPTAKSNKLTAEEVERLHQAIPQIKIQAPPSDCVVPIGEDLIRAGMERLYDAEFFTSSTRPPAVYRGNPFVIEVGLAYGGKLDGDAPCELMRFANRVPLQYQKGACAITQSVLDTAWRGYGVQQSRGAQPNGPLALLVHIASVWVPFTSESKEAIAHYPEIIKEMRLGLQECGRRLGMYLSHRRREADARKKMSYIEKYIPHIGLAIQEMLGIPDGERDAAMDTLVDTLERSRKVK
ncbi:MAG: DNA topoisomerase VI subunit B [Deltaproteobacteria bacterium]|nr:DNA topoisomerase VI subunit B [Deltaproteobacteria bacterium]